LCEFLQKKTGLRYRSIERMLVNENGLDMEDLMDKDSGYQNFSKELLKYLIAQAEMENLKTTNPQAETKILDWFYKGLKELYANVPPLKKLNPKYEKFHLDNELIDFAIYPDKIATFIDAAIQGFIKQQIAKI
jgi:Fe-S cluster biosynthesis and repair protein YggX